MLKDANIALFVSPWGRLDVCPRGMFHDITIKTPSIRATVREVMLVGIESFASAADEMHRTLTGAATLRSEHGEFCLTLGAGERGAVLAEIKLDNRDHDKTGFHAAIQVSLDQSYIPGMIEGLRMVAQVTAGY